MLKMTFSAKITDRFSHYLPLHIVGHGLISLTIKLFGAVLAYAMVVAFARFLTTEEYGRFAFGMNLAIIVAAIGSFGFSTGIMRYWPKYTVSKDFDGARGVVRLGYQACMVGGFVMLCIAMIGSVLAFVFQSKNQFTEFAAIGFLGWLIGIGDYSSNLLRAQGNTIVSMLPRDVLWRIFSVAIAGLIIWLGFTISGPTALMVCAVVLFALTVWQVTTVQKNMSVIAGQTSRNDWKKLRQSFVPFWASSVIFAMIQQFDVVIIGSLLGNAEAGAYFAAQKTALLLSLVLIAAGLATAPTMAALFHSGKRDELQRLCRNLAIVIATLSLIGFLFLVLLGHQLLGLFDQQFVSAYPILLIIGVGCLIDAVSGPSAYLMQMTSFERPYLRVMIVCYIFVVAAQFILIPRYGSFGAALASTGGVVLWNVWSIFILRNKAGLDPSLLSIFFPTKQSITP
jgi:O-antigen/teichoic acid export membrane protein